jgi:hypothetical protein
VRDLLRFGRDEARTARGTGDLEQRAGKPGRVARELYRRRVGQTLAMTRDGGLQQPAEKHADVAENHHRERGEQERAGAVLAAAAAHTR